MTRKKGKALLLIGLLLVFGIIACTWILPLPLPENMWSTIEAVATALGVIMVLMELKESRDLSEGTFVSGLSDSFNSNESIQRIYKKMELKLEITEDDTIDIVTYLTCFETIYVLLKKGIIDISLIDDLFGYRFKLALNSPAFRRISLIRHDYAYVNIYKLEQLWCKHTGKDSVLKAHNPNYNILISGNKMSEKDIVLKIASYENADEIHHVMEDVHDRLEDKRLYVCDDLEHVRSLIRKEGFIIIACNKDSKIVGCFTFRYPGRRDDNLGRDIGLADEQLDQVVHMESVAVLPEYRGRGLQLAMLKYAEELIDPSKYKYFMATVSPDNPWSYNSFERDGYKLMDTKEKYEGLIRRIYCKQV